MKEYILDKLKIFNRSQYSKTKDLKITIILSVSIYLASSIFIFIMSLEDNYDNLKYGSLLTILFYLQLIVFVINSTVFKDKERLKKLKIKFEQRFEIIIRCIVFIIANINLSRFNINIPLEYKYIIIVFCLGISSFIIVDMHKKLKGDTPINNNSFSENKQNKTDNHDYMSLCGLILYVYSINIIGQASGMFSLMLKGIVFCCSVFFIKKNLQDYYQKTNEVNDRLSIIIGSLIAGFVLNLLVATIVLCYFNDLSIGDMTGIKDGMFIVGLLCGLPLLNLYNKLHRLRE